MNSRSFIQEVEARRKRMEMSKTNLCKGAGLSLTHYNNVLRGSHGLSLDKAFDICGVLECRLLVIPETAIEALTVK